MPVSTEPKSRAANIQKTRAEQETTTEAERLTTLINSARAVVAQPTADENELLACADRLERAARDLAVALRELARERRNQINQKP